MGLPLEIAFVILDEVKSNLDSIAGQEGLLLQNKFNSVLERNPNALVLRSIVGCLKVRKAPSPKDLVLETSPTSSSAILPMSTWKEPFQSTKLY